MAAFRSSSSSPCSTLFLRVVLFSVCTTLLLCPATSATTTTATTAAAAADASNDVRTEQLGSRENPMTKMNDQIMDGGVPLVDSFYVEFAKDNNEGASHFRSLQEDGGMMTVAPTSAPTAAPTASPSSAPTVFSTPAMTSGGGYSWRSSSPSTRQSTAAAATMIVILSASLASAMMAR